MLGSQDQKIGAFILRSLRQALDDERENPRLSVSPSPIRACCNSDGFDQRPRIGRTDVLESNCDQPTPQPSAIKLLVSRRRTVG